VIPGRHKIASRILHNSVGCPGNKEYIMKTLLRLMIIVKQSEVNDIMDISGRVPHMVVSFLSQLHTII